MIVTDDILACYLKSMLGNPERIVELDGITEKEINEGDIVVYKNNEKMYFYQAEFSARLSLPDNRFLNRINPFNVNNFMADYLLYKDKVYDIKPKYLEKIKKKYDFFKNEVLVNAYSTFSNLFYTRKIFEQVSDDYIIQILKDKIEPLCFAYINYWGLVNRPKVLEYMYNNCKILSGASSQRSGGRYIILEVSLNNGYAFNRHGAAMKNDTSYDWFDCKEKFAFIKKYNTYVDLIRNDSESDDWVKYYEFE